ncbi:DUF6471 domain-containing protein [Paraneptunicella aestuarii]|uniref:DUF6471 domain-containing protein n=1 Tax=Paraneptunicella aestuarii TaxID=2831148 RepID=UPI001E63092C|nr:DUF6471 domain-containing protein [Paraneptunicella aestuarii]
MSTVNHQADWRQMLQRLLKTEMSRRGIKYQELSERLAVIGVQQSADNLRNKVNKGIMGADLLLQIMFVLNIQKIAREDILIVFEAMGVEPYSGDMG